MSKQDKESSAKTPQDTEAAPDVRVMVCALLLAMAHVDYEFLPEERELIKTLLMAEFNLNDAEMETLLSAGDKERNRYADLWPLVEAINQSYATDKKLELLVMLWKVIFADKRLDAHEELLMRKLEPQLDVDHETVVEAMRIARGGADLEKPKL